MMMMTQEEDRVMLERMRVVIRSAGALTKKQVLEQVEGLSPYSCVRLLNRLIGEKFITKTYESQWTKPDGRPCYAYVYRLVRPPEDGAP
jgi:hypothetical protein